MKVWKPLLLIVLVLILDQWLKLWVAYNMVPGQDIPIFGDWFILHYTKNPGIAFGITWGGRTGKLFLTLFRMLAVVGFGFVIHYLLKTRRPMGMVLSVALITAGALGNIIDSIFYGPLFEYEEYFYGHVVDMLYFPIWQGYFPHWVPIWGGDYFLFFRPVFNIADTAITTGVLSIILFYRRVFAEI